MTALAAFCFAVAAARIAGVVRILRDLTARQRRSLEGVDA